ncbi:hypothetical protein PtA15_5A631 [Puccinia triticina]|uniref:Uncharacterized protein n=1 Tax=Puccinia triticina TaxID=208348 RepID=A0ABY7CKR8_9BASI|nr:uncharacterized protein PtA15_5A631 [Puccinia triticina]WAQ85057.1 hypothetical protein PtA15_5A631 [Puccinia triticina]WAR58388.1 hypothetical protein PtB15_5B622 [Puccinia triticina]
MLFLQILAITCTIIGPTFSIPTETSAANFASEEANLAASRAEIDHTTFPEIAPNRASTSQATVHEELGLQSSDSASESDGIIEQGKAKELKVHLPEEVDAMITAALKHQKHALRMQS